MRRPPPVMIQRSGAAGNQSRLRCDRGGGDGDERRRAVGRRQSVERETCEAVAVERLGRRFLEEAVAQELREGCLDPRAR